MITEKHIRIKNNLFLLEEENLLCFQKTYGNGIEFPNTEISKIIITAFNDHSFCKDIINAITTKTGLQNEHVMIVLEKWFELGLIESFDTDTVGTESIERYNRQLVFFDALSPLQNFSDNIQRQSKLSKTHILIIGIGGIGNYAALSFTAMGIGKITLVDADRVELSNLSRQIIFKDSSITKLKTEVAIEQLKEINPVCELAHYPTLINSKDELETIINQIEPVDFVFVSADKPLQMPYWVDDLAPNHNFSFINCSYQSYTGFVGPLITKGGKRYSEIVKTESQILNKSSDFVEQLNSKFKHPSTSSSNAILANMAVLESIKHILELGNSNVLEKRAVFNLNKFELTYE